MNELALHACHGRLGARFAQVNGMEVVADYGNVAAEYAAFRQRAALLDLSFRGRFCLIGRDRQRFLNGQVTNNILNLVPGQGCYALLVNQKARVLGDALIYCLEGELLLDREPGHAGAMARRLEQFIVADDVQMVSVESAYGLLSVQGPLAASVVQAALSLPAVPEKIFSFQQYKHAVWGEIYCMRAPRAGVAGLDVYVPAAAAEAAWEVLAKQTRAMGGTPAGWEVLEIARIEAGFPRYGVDMDENHLAPEADPAGRGISYAKGCYTGQEVIARIRAFGHVNRQLSGLKLEQGLTSLPGKGVKLAVHGKEAGYVTSAVYSPGLNQNIALGYVRREFQTPGMELTLEMPGRPAKAWLAALPFV